MVHTLLLLIHLFHYTQSETEYDSNSELLVNTNYGWIQGSINNIGRSFTSIPYAKPPIPENDLRFRNPVPPDSWTHILDATKIAPACMQPDCNERGITCYKSIYAEMSEDCLYLNIYNPPLQSESDPLPVMFYIHGGTYIRQWSGSELYDGQRMAYLNDVIVVTVNYRVGSFGFFYDKSNNFDGNYGYYDQLLALQFVYDNIESFGGNKSKIVLVGESAGAMSVATLLMDSSNKMYSGAIMLSNPLGLPFRTSKSWQNVPQTYIESAGCIENTEYCMRNQVTADELLIAQNEVGSDALSFCKWFNCYWIFLFMPWTPTFETNTLPQTQPLQAFLDGDYNKVPMILGTNFDEGVSFVYDLVASMFDGNYSHGLCREQYKALIYAIMGKDSGNKIIEQFKNDEPDCVGGDYRPLLSKIAGELLFICPSRNSTESISKYSNVWKYNYNYLYVFDPPETYFGDNIYCQGVDDNICHGVELPIVFQSKTLDFSDRDIRLSNLIQIYFTNVAKFGEPSIESSSDKYKWEKYELPTEWSMVFTDEGCNELKKGFEQENGHNCAFWDELGYPQLWWQDSPFSLFDSNFLNAMFSNETFKQELQSNDTCNVDCSEKEIYSSGMESILKEEPYTKASTYDDNIVNILVPFMYIFVGIFFLGVGVFIGIKSNTISSASK
eukprot:15481_1